jgi:hypothetical protein
MLCFRLPAVLCLSLLPAAAALAKDAPQEIKPVKATSSAGGDPKQLIDGSGLSKEDNIMARTHKTMEKGGGFWNADALPKGQAYQDGDKKRKPPELVFDLGGTYKLRGLVLWNYSYAEGNTDAQMRAVAKMSLWTADSDKGPWTLAGITKVQDTRAMHEAVRAQAIPFGTKPTKFVKIILLENHGSPGNMGFGELRFMGTPAEEVKAEPKKDAKKEEKKDDKKDMKKDDKKEVKKP